MDVAINTPNQLQYWYESFRSHFMAMGLRSGYHKEEISDLISQLFLDLLEKNIDPRTINNPQAWLSTAFRRKLIDHYRSSSKNRFIDAGKILEEYAVPSVQDTLEQVQANAELVAQIRKAYKKLPNRCQKVIYFKFYKGLTTEQIADQTGLNKRTVYNNLFEGVKLLRKELNQQFPGFQFAAMLSILPLLPTDISF
ncbi:MAG TPA: sigma-70 family RNA polymerase sigma factor [Chitinophagaceae bacterium]|nr:sigma-70 family RNA polymerase sigma factor [Chitinophagaceae bacterium]